MIILIHSSIIFKLEVGEVDGVHISNTTVIPIGGLIV